MEKNNNSGQSSYMYVYVRETATNAYTNIDNIYLMHIQCHTVFCIKYNIHIRSEMEYQHIT